MVLLHQLIKHEMQQIMNGQVVENPTTMEDDKDETVVVAEDTSATSCEGLIAIPSPIIFSLNT
jgi:hypothetical protein